MSFYSRFLGLFVLCAALTGCAQIQLGSHFAKKMSGEQSKGAYKVGSPYKVNGVWYRPVVDYGYDETGIASWYGPGFHGKKTANGETFDENELTAAHKTLPLPTLVRVTNLDNGRSLVVRVNDRGPYAKSRIIDLSKRSAELLGFKGRGTAKVRVQVMEKESRIIADAARRGEDTRGAEVPLNDKRYAATNSPYTPRPGVQQASYSQGPGAQPVPIVNQESLPPADVSGHVRNGAFYPDPVVQQLPVHPTRIYVQAGSFSVQENALKFADKLKAVSSDAGVYPAMVDNTMYYRVRIPAQDVAQADSLLAEVLRSGDENAIIVVDEIPRP
ncbi:MAG: septal ring lytic transglycosylase RlpA family protein [Alphaproteobacteria bacterium]|nr:septal ring lytic transglycosylase RlpA family protein [Alphaproteobacteria bacterium]